MLTPRMLSSLRLFWFALAGLIGATFLSHQPALDGELLGWDDRRALLDLSEWRGLGWPNIEWAFTTTAMAIYRPLTWLTYGFDFQSSGLDARGFHRTNLALHLAAAGALYVFIVRWLGVVAQARAPAAERSANTASSSGAVLPALLAALAWSIHPLRVQVVAWISARADLLAALFLISASIAWLSWTTRGDRRARIAWHALYAASLLAKPVALGAPIAWWLAQWWLSRTGVCAPSEPSGLVDRNRLGAVADADTGTGSRTARRIDRGISFATAAAGAGAILIAKAGWTPSEGLPQLPASAAFVALHNAVFPLFKTFWPVELGYYEPRYPFDPWAANYVVGAVVALALAALLVWKRREWPGAVAAAASYLCLLAPMLGVVPFGYEVVADRFSFVPMLVFSVALSKPLADWLATRPAKSSATRLALAAAAVVVLGFAMLTRENTTHWRTSADFWRHNYAIDPDSGMANSGMGDAMLKEDRLDDAAAFYLRARELQPEYQPTLLGLAFIDLRRDRFVEAIPKLEVYLASHIENRNAKRWLAAAYAATGRQSDAAAVQQLIAEQERTDRGER